MHYGSLVQMERSDTKYFDYGFIDSHLHLDLFDNPKAIIEKSLNNNLSFLLTAGSNRESNIKNISISDGKNVFVAVGISPDFYQDYFDISDLFKYKQVIAVGEIGLDTTIDTPLDKQLDIFKKQIEIAKEKEVPVIIHSRGALDKVVNILEEANVKRAVFHFFEGDINIARSLAKKGYKISIPVKLNSKKKIIVKELEIENLLFETDAPVAGEFPWDVIELYNYASKVRGKDINDIKDAIFNNFREYFYI